MSEYVVIRKENLTAIADAIRGYTGDNKLYTLDEMEEFFESQFAKLIQRDIKTLIIPNGTTDIRTKVFYGCPYLTNVTFLSKVTSIATDAFGNCTKLTTINVPWSEGEIAGAPWGATNATINYNHTGGEV